MPGRDLLVALGQRLCNGGGDGVVERHEPGGHLVDLGAEQGSRVRVVGGHPRHRVGTVEGDGVEQRLRARWWRSRRRGAPSITARERVPCGLHPGRELGDVDRPGLRRCPPPTSALDRRSPAVSGDAAESFASQSPSVSSSASPPVAVGRGRVGEQLELVARVGGHLGREGEPDALHELARRRPGPSSAWPARPRGARGRDRQARPARAASRCRRAHARRRRTASPPGGPSRRATQASSIGSAAPRVSRRQPAGSAVALHGDRDSMRHGLPRLRGADVVEVGRPAVPVVGRERGPRAVEVAHRGLVHALGDEQVADRVVAVVDVADHLPQRGRRPRRAAWRRARPASRSRRGRRSGRRASGRAARPRRRHHGRPGPRPARPARRPARAAAPSGASASGSASSSDRTRAGGARAGSRGARPGAGPGRPPRAARARGVPGRTSPRGRRRRRRRRGWRAGRFAAARCWPRGRARACARNRGSRRPRRRRAAGPRRPPSIRCARRPADAGAMVGEPRRREAGEPRVEAGREEVEVAPERPLELVDRRPRQPPQRDLVVRRASSRDPSALRAVRRGRRACEPNSPVTNSPSGLADTSGTTASASWRPERKSSAVGGTAGASSTRTESGVGIERRARAGSFASASDVSCIRSRVTLSAQWSSSSTALQAASASSRAIESSRRFRAARPTGRRSGRRSRRGTPWDSPARLWPPAGRAAGGPCRGSAR